MRKVFVALALLLMTGPVQSQTSVQSDLNDRVVRSRAFEAVVWGMPAANYQIGRASCRERV